MFRKGIVTFFDDRLGLGHIELASDHQQVVFKLENFSNTSILPQIGERVKCIVVEEHGEFLAKFIVRLDHKNYVADKNKQPSSKLVYDESSFENVHNSRKILKKRRISADTIAHKNEHISENAVVDQNIPAAKDNNESASSKNVFATQSTQTVQFQRVAIQPQIIKSSSYTEKFVEAIKPIQIIEAQNVKEETPSVEKDESVSDEVILEEVATVQEVDASEPVINESIHEAVEEVIIPEPIQPVQIEAEQDVIDEIPVAEIDEPVLNESIHKPVEVVQPVEFSKPAQNHLHIDKSMESIVVNEQTFTEVPALDTVVAEKEIPVPKVKSVDLQQQLRDRQLLEKKMNLSGFQKFIQQMKVKFLYSKRKQVQVKPELTKRFHFNPWILVTGVVLLVTINFGFYAHDRYTEYKSENLLKLQQYEKEQKEEIKRQKREATAR